MKPVKVGFLGGGSIANTVARALDQVPEIEKYGIATRDPERSRAFAKQNRFTRAFDSYEAMAACPDIDFIYIATPHSHHHEHMMLCLKQKKNVLCEKAFTATAREAEEVIRFAQQEKVLLAEAIWTRYMPSRNIINRIISDGQIGTPVGLTANLGYRVNHHQRMIRPELAGGALLDLGVYPINFAMMFFGDQFKKITSACTLMDTGVDASNSITIEYQNGMLAVLMTTQLAQTDRRGAIYGDQGYLIVDNINNPTEIDVFNQKHELLDKHLIDRQISGYTYEFRSMAHCIREGLTECPEMPLEETLRIMRLLDQIRHEWGVIYPADQQK